MRIDVKNKAVIKDYIMKIVLSEYCYISCVFAAILFFFYENDVAGQILMAISLLDIFVQAVIENKKAKEIMQYWIIVGFLFFISLLATYRSYMKNLAIACLLLGTSLLISIVRYFKVPCEERDRKKLDFSFFLKSHYLFIIEVVVFIVLAMHNLGRIPVFDSGCYYSWGGVSNLALFDEYSIKKFLLAGHLSIGYSAFALIGELILPHNVVGVQIVQIFMAIFAFCSLYIVLCKSYTSKKISLVMPLLMFNPMSLGMITEVNADNPCVFIFILMACFYWNELYALFYLFAFLFVNSKEPNVIYYFFFCLAYVLVLAVKEKWNIKALLSRWNEIVRMSVPAIFWILCYISPSYKLKEAFVNVGDDAIQNFAISSEYIRVRLAQFFVENFQWMLFLFVVGLVAYRFLLKKSVDLKIWYVISVMTGLVAFNLLYINQTHTRYICLWYILTAIFVMIEVLTTDKICGYFIAIIVAISLFVQTYISVDPFTNIFFMKVDTGTNYQLLSTSRILTNGTASYIDDTSVYNMEYYKYFEEIDNILQQYSYDDNMAVIYSNFSPGPGVYGTSKGFLNYDTSKKHIATYYSEATVPLNWAESSEELDGFDTVLVLRVHNMDSNEDLIDYMDSFEKEDEAVFDDVMMIECSLWKRK